MTPDQHPVNEAERRAALLARAKGRGNQIKRRRRHLVAGSGIAVAAAVVVLVAVIVPHVTAGSGRTDAQHHGAGSGGTTTTAPPVAATLLARGVQSSVSTIPWNQVGSGWTLATWGQDPAVPSGGSLPAGAVPTTEETVTLFLVNPIGGRYAISTFPPGTSVDLAAWSGDGRRALLTSVDATDTHEQVTEIDIATGETINTFTVDAGVSVSYTEPDGLDILATGYTSGHTEIRRLNRQGTQQLLYPSTFSQVGTADGGVVSNSEGTQLVIGASRGVAVVANDGTVIRQVPMSGACQAQRFWKATVILASCASTSPGPDAPPTRLWLIPMSGASPTPFESANPDPGTDLGDLDAWSLGNSTFVQATGACGLAYVAQLRADGTTSPVAVPGTDASQSEFIKGTYGDRLAIQAKIACGPGETLVWFTPSDDSTNLILGPPLNGGGVIDAIVYADVGAASP